MLIIYFLSLVEYDCHAQSMDHGQSGETDDEGIERDSAECEETLRNNFATFDDVLEVNINIFHLTSFILKEKIIITKH